MDDYSKKQYIKANVTSLNRAQIISVGKIVVVAGEKLYMEVSANGTKIDMNKLSSDTIDRMYWCIKRYLSA